MADEGLDQLSPKAFKSQLLNAVAAENIDEVPEDFSDIARFVLCAVRAAARRTDLTSPCAFLYSEAARAEVQQHGFSLTAHMQDGHGAFSGAIVLTNREANNGMMRSCSNAEPAAIITEIEGLGFAERCTVFWDPAERVATIYPSGIQDLDNHIRNSIRASDADLTQDQVCAALTHAYNENLCNPSGRTAKLWVKKKLVATAEDEIERHLKGQLSTFFAGHKRRIKILSQTNMTAGRADLIFLQRADSGGPTMVGVLELKVLRGPDAKDWETTTEGLAQAHYYRADLELPFATLALFDVTDPPSADEAPLLVGQEADHLAVVRVRRFPLYNSPASWRAAGGHTAAA